LERVRRGVSRAQWSREQLVVITVLLAVGAGLLAVALESVVFELLQVRPLVAAFIGALVGMAAFTAIIWRRLLAAEDERSAFQQLATIDDLTGALNRRALADLSAPLLAAARRYDRPMGVVLLDLDNFKLINDRYGHTAGDEALQSVARRCNAVKRASDLFVRYGGDEFLFIVPEADATTLEQFAARLRESLREHALEQSGDRIAMSGSIGCALLDLGNSADSIEAMIARADAALYREKAARFRPPELVGTPSRPSVPEPAA
jgi:diguanylate cyclase